MGSLAGQLDPPRNVPIFFYKKCIIPETTWSGLDSQQWVSVEIPRYIKTKVCSETTEPGV